MTTEDKLPSENHPPAQISLTDCLACSGCVTSAEAVLVSLQSHAEVLNALDGCPSIGSHRLRGGLIDSSANGDEEDRENGKVFVASVSPQVRASVAATYGVNEQEAGWMIEQLLSGPSGLRSGGKYGNGFTWVVDTNIMREACLVVGADETIESARAGDTEKLDVATTRPTRPVLTSSCPGWICYAEKTHPHVLPHLSRLKSPQALTGILLKTVLSTQLRIPPDRIWHVAIMPCFDKKLEASRAELTDAYWRSETEGKPRVRDVDCVITARELLMLADARGISFPNLPRTPPVLSDHIPFPDPKLDHFLFPQYQHQLDRRRHPRNNPSIAGTSGGFLHYILQTYQASHPGSQIHHERGRNPDVVEYTLVDKDNRTILLKAARYYGFRNIQNLVRKLKPARQSRMPGGRLIVPGGGSRRPGQPKGAASSQTGGSEYAYVEVMACPGGCTNGGGQIKVDDLIHVKGVVPHGAGENVGQAEQKAWLGKVDEAYFSADSETEDDAGAQVNGDGEVGAKTSGEEVVDVVNGISTSYIRGVLTHWSSITGIELEKLVYTSYRRVESDVGKGGAGDVDRVVELAGKIGGGW